MTIELLCIDADDTLWYNERHFKSAETAFSDLMASFATQEVALARLAAAGVANVSLYGFGAKGFTLSMIEAALALAGDKLPAATVGSLIELGRDLHNYTLELLDGVADTLAILSSQVRLFLPTKGDIIHQEAKLAASGVDVFFEGVEVVSGKSQATFEKVFAQCKVEPRRAAMVGDSIKSDILPALGAGAWGIFIPPEHVSHYEQAPTPELAIRFIRLKRFSDLPSWLAEMARG